MNNKCTVLVCSCDAYEDTWYPFFKIFKAEWPNCPFKIILNTECKKYEYEGLDIRTLNLYQQGDSVSWGQRMIDHLNSIESEFVLVMLDDFFLCRPVDEEKIMTCINWLESDKRIASFSFYKSSVKNIDDGKYPGFERRKHFGEYKLNCQAAVWRTETLKKYLRNHESPWLWEIAGNMRSYRTADKFYAIKPHVLSPIDYNGPGFGVFRGKWTRSYVEDLFKKHDIDIDFSQRGESTAESVAKMQNARQNPLVFKMKSIICNAITLMKNPKSLF
ncbi:MAG: hypothetical protein RSD08_04850 [Oscillospiraceae bacterium]